MDQHVCIRPATLRDAEALRAIYAPYVRRTAVTFEWQVPTARQFARRMAQTLQSWPYLVAERDGQVAGYAYAGPFHPRRAYAWAAEVTVYLDSSQQGRGIGGALYAALEQALAQKGILNCYACIAYPAEGEEDAYLTLRSPRFHARQGYVQVGRFHRCGYKFGRWYDMIWMEKHLGPHTVPPPELQS